jgi:ribonuclease D
VVTTVATTHHLPPENLVAPDSIRRLAWTPPDPLGVDTVSETLAGYGARRWQIDLLAAGLAKALEPEDKAPEAEECEEPQPPEPY